MDRADIAGRVGYLPHALRVVRAFLQQRFADVEVPLVVLERECWFAEPFEHDTQAIVTVRDRLSALGVGRVARGKPFFQCETHLELTPRPLEIPFGLQRSGDVAVTVGELEEI